LGSSETPKILKNLVITLNSVKEPDKLTKVPAIIPKIKPKGSLTKAKNAKTLANKSKAKSNPIYTSPLKLDFKSDNLTAGPEAIKVIVRLNTLTPLPKETKKLAINLGALTKCKKPPKITVTPPKNASQTTILPINLETSRGKRPASVASIINLSNPPALPRNPPISIKIPATTANKP